VNRPRGEGMLRHRSTRKVRQSFAVAVPGHRYQRRPVSTRRYGSTMRRDERRRAGRSGKDTLRRSVIAAERAVSTAGSTGVLAAAMRVTPSAARRSWAGAARAAPVRVCQGTHRCSPTPGHRACGHGCQADRHGQRFVVIEQQRAELAPGAELVAPGDARRGGNGVPRVRSLPMSRRTVRRSLMRWARAGRSIPCASASRRAGAAAGRGLQHGFTTPARTESCPHRF
jgi:hypothetical protein